MTDNEKEEAIEKIDNMIFDMQMKIHEAQESGGREKQNEGWIETNGKYNDII
jgi:hypothetical protein